MCAAVKTFSIGSFDLNPRGNLWVKDENKFGQKLLSKMGWSEGKGLGKNENGITDCVKVRMKVGHSGVGFSEKLPLGIENDTYNAVLESLNKKFKSNGETTKVVKDTNGLERRSQQFKNRLHYQKFVRGKDVCRYSEKDMSGIFVTRRQDVEQHTAAPLKSTVTNVDASGNSAPELLPTFHSQLSMKDYFAMKLKKKSEVAQSNLSTEVSQQTESTPLKNRTSSKKRKKELKNNTKASKRVKCELPDTSEENISTSKLDDNHTEEIPTEVKKGKKNKKSKWAGKLKSCLKSKFASSGLWFKQEPKEVSFNDSVSYKIIENILDEDTEEVLNEDFMCKETENHSTGLEEDTFEYVDDVFVDGIESTAEVDTFEYLDDVFVDDVESTVDSCKNIGNVLNGDNKTDESKDGILEEGECLDAEDGDGCCLQKSSDNSNGTDNWDWSADARPVASDIPQCLVLPKCDNSNYNAWLESQRIAIKMKLYKNMVKKIRKNPVLRTSSILDLKGYGNWGF